MAKARDQRDRLPDHLDHLYGLPLDEFITARGDLAKSLKAEGNREAAGEVQRARKPTVAAWATNQVARAHPKEMEDLLHAGEEVRTAQKDALAGGGRAKLRAATDRRKDLVDQLVGRAEEILRSAGHGPTRGHLDQIQNTLLATATDEQTARLVRLGVLEKEVPAPAGFGEMGDPDSATLPSAAPTPVRTGAQRARRVRLQGEADEAESEAERLEREAAQAQEVLAGARKAADRARELADRAREVADRARERAVKSRRRAEQAVED
jgi:hypothetical protein